MRKFFIFKKLSTKDLCALALLTAITVILALTATIRIGNYIKIPLKFISVFLTGVLFGPLWAGASAAVGDIFNAFFSPVGSFMPQITLVEFLSGFLFGFFMFGTQKNQNRFYAKACLCVLAQFMLDMFVTPVFLVQAGIFPSYASAIAIRFAASLLKAAMQSAVLLSGKAYLKFFAGRVARNNG